MSNKWVGSLGGILFAASFVPGFARGEFGPEPADSARTVLAEFRDKSDEIELTALLALGGLGFLLLFLGHLRSRLRDSGVGWAADSLLAGGVALAAAAMIVLGIEIAGAVAGEHEHAEVAQVAVDFLWNAVWLFSPGLLVVGISAATASFAHRALPTWVGVFSALLVLGALMPWVGFPLFVAWVLAVSIVELARKDRPTTAPG